MTEWTLFVNPMDLPSGRILWLCLPLCLAVAVIHRTLRNRTLTRLWRSIGFLMLEILLALGVLTALLWLILICWIG
ncbi:MAG: hypothetical protein ACYS8X_07025 [Planctomycetota bacterium]|jgi:hypothetical protein